MEEVSMFVPGYRLTDIPVGMIGEQEIKVKQWVLGYHGISFVKDRNYPWVEIYENWFPDDGMGLVLDSNFWHEVSLPVGKLNSRGKIIPYENYEGEAVLTLIDGVLIYLQALGVMKIKVEEDIMGYEYKKPRIPG